MNLAITDFDQIFAALNESVDLSENRGLIENPSLAGILVLAQRGLTVDLFPLVAAFDALNKIANRRLDPSVKNCV